MEWNVKNALSRDVEREHLNKILKEIQAAVDSVSTEGLSRAEIEQLIAEAIGAIPSPSFGSFTISLQGDATGSGTVVNLSDTSISVTIDPDLLGIPDAPMDSNVYWRGQGVWQAVPGSLIQLGLLENEGLVAWTVEEGWIVREIEGAAGNIVVTDGDGVAGNPTIGLADTAVTPGTYGDATHAVVITVDQKGRLTAVTTEEIEGGGGGIETIVEGTGIEVDDTDPENPIVGLDAATQASLALADSAVQDLGDLGITATATELNYTDGVTSPIQTQLDGKEPAFAKGSIVAGTNVSVTGTLTDRLVGAGNITISATNNYGISFVAGENIDAGDFVYVFSDGMVYKADNSSPDTAAVGFAPSSITSAASGLILVNGLNAAMSGLTPGVTYALDLTGGVTTLDLLPTTPGTIIQVLGTGITVSSMMVDIQQAILRG